MEYTAIKRSFYRSVKNWFGHCQAGRNN